MFGQYNLSIAVGREWRDLRSRAAPRQSASLLGRLDIMIHTAILQVLDKNAANRALQPVVEADHYYVLDIISDAWCAGTHILYCMWAHSTAHAVPMLFLRFIAYSLDVNSGVMGTLVRKYKE